MRQHVSRATAALSTLGLAGTALLVLPASPLAFAADGDHVNVVVNELDSTTDRVELFNKGSVAVDISGWMQVDSDTTHAAAAIAPAETSLEPGAFYVFASTSGLGGGGDGVRLLLPDGTTVVDSVDYPANAAAVSYSRCPDGTGNFGAVHTATFGQSNAIGCAPASDPVIDPNWDDIVINEISSDNDPSPVGDAVELYNTGAQAVNITGWTQTDSGGTPSAFAPNVTVIPPGGHAVFASTRGLSGEGDGVRLYLPDRATLVDEVAYPDGGAGVSDTYEELGIETGVGAYAACPDGSGGFFPVAEKSFGDSNFGSCDNRVDLDGLPESPWLDLDCIPEHPSGTGTVAVGGVVAWPGSADVEVADTECAWKTTTGEEGRDMSGLDIDPSTPDVMWAVKNKNWIFRLVQDGDIWVTDAATQGWAAGKEIRFPGGTGQPDTEGVTVGGDGALYVTTERNNTASAIPLNSVLRIDPNSTDTVATATQQWDLTTDFAHLATTSGGSNLGFEGLTFVPDTYLTTNGFVDQNTGLAYDPGDYPDHGTGLFFMALEHDGHLYGYALNSDGTYDRIADVDTGLGRAMDVQYDPQLERIWAMCDNTCSVAFSILRIDAGGALVPEVKYAAPAGLPIVNIEGFALTPTCVDGTREITWSDDSLSAEESAGHALYAGTLPCSLDLGEQGLQPQLVLGLGGPGAAQRGGNVTISATGFAKGETLQVWVDPTSRLLGTVEADADGRATLTVPLAPSYRAGKHSVVVTGGLSGATVSSPLVP